MKFAPRVTHISRHGKDGERVGDRTFMHYIGSFIHLTDKGEIKEESEGRWGMCGWTEQQCKRDE